MQRAYVLSPIGVIEITAEERGIASIHFVDDIGPQAAVLSPVLEEARDQLVQYFAGTRRKFSFVPVSADATPFVHAVWEAARRIPYGETLSYGELAARAGHTGAARAVGTAMKDNPLCIVIPCHRVVPSTGRDIGEYGGGKHRKKWLLDHEKKVVMPPVVVGV